MNGLVVDASVATSWGLADEDHPLAVRALARLQEAGACAPGLWWFEVRNALIVAERRHRIAEADVAYFLAQLARLSIHLDHEPSEDQLLRLARRYALTAYDAAYLEVALRRRLPLATLDRALANAAALEGVETL